ncbi:MAG: hypothetical protein IT304_02895 [Dehalococcoidia bacterium]|nr:hypothetical protein [Dehalococcoidia bacterium]
MPRFVLIGLVEPTSPDNQAAFDEWFIGQHVEDTARCPNFVRGAAYKLAGGHLGSEPVSRYLSVYEVEAPSYEEAEKTLNAWQRDPDAWPGRAHHTATREKYGAIPMRIAGSGWYELQTEYPPRP